MIECRLYVGIEYVAVFAFIFSGGVVFSPRKFIKYDFREFPLKDYGSYIEYRVSTCLNAITS